MNILQRQLKNKPYEKSLIMELEHLNAYLDTLLLKK